MLKFILLLFLLLSNAVFAQIYKSTDEKGNVIYSDQPTTGATQVQLPPGPPPTPAQPTSGPNETTKASEQLPPQEPEQKHSYKRLDILQPTQDQHLYNREVPVELDLDPPLLEGDQISLLLDNKEVTQLTTSGGLILQDVERGTHTLQAQVVDKQGSALIASDTITFYMHQASVK